ncbi:RDD family protein [Streptomyces sp. ADI97-07]|uniref:RDD family protein n=1 Tax=Streptomyces sp. ADI97-07 TaxID=1522762 RepID=UPI000F55614B|nr:RDD family protein [Streptomyces sp. ADI97-07]RPK77408.1 RDD family protein [Streptomyces sp. ADI97-07]
MNELVTGDAVVLGLQPARLPSRALAIAIDLAVVLTVFVLISIGLAVATVSLDEAASAAIAVATFLLVLVGGPIAVETLSQGRSLGKLACGLRVVRDDGGPIRFRHALVRGSMGVVEILGTFGVVACTASLVSARGRRIGDVFAGTLVVRERVPTGRAVAVPPPPPWLVGRFAPLDLSAVPDDLWLAIRQYLTRMHQLDAAVGRSIAERLSGDLAARTGVPVPQGVPAAAYLAAVVNERQARDVRRVASAARLNHPPQTPVPVASPVGTPSGPVRPGGLPLPGGPTGGPRTASPWDVRPAGDDVPHTAPAPPVTAPPRAGTTPAEGTGGAGGPEGPGTTGFAPPA